MTLIAIILISAASMVVNDYYDTLLGVDQNLPTMNPLVYINQTNSLESSVTDRKPLISGEVTFSMVKTFLYYLYSGILISLAFLPGIPTRISVVVATILTFIYTKHLKPMTWTKNIVCATIMALSPFTSGAATLYVMTMDQQMRHLLLEGVSWIQRLQDWQGILYILITSLGPLVMTLFCGFMAREIVMDVSDYESDKASRIMTIPVRHGRKVATRVAIAFLYAMVVSACFEPLRLLVNVNWRDIFHSYPFVGGPKGLKLLILSMQKTLFIPAVVKLFFSMAGSFWMLIRLLQVVQSNGSDKRLLNRFIEDGKGAILLLLTSFALK